LYETPADAVSWVSARICAFDLFGDLRRGRDALKILSYIEVGFVERQRLDNRSVLGEYRTDL
jgi:hypothetical protein